MNEVAAIEQIAALGDRVEGPPQRGRVVMIVRQVRSDRAFYGFIVAKDAIEFVRERKCPVGWRRERLPEQVDGVLAVSRARQFRKLCCGVLHLAEKGHMESVR